jgi:tetratricopeptide (TPR) repeat protein
LKSSINHLSNPQLQDAYAIRNWADKYFKLKKFDDAIENYLIAIKSLGDVYGPQEEIVIESKMQLARCYFEANHNKEAFIVYKELIANQGLLSKTDASYVYIAVGNLHNRIKEFKLAIENYEKALVIKLTYTKGNSTDLALLHSTIALTAKANKDFHKSLEHYGKMKKVLISLHERCEQ